MPAVRPAASNARWTLADTAFGFDDATDGSSKQLAAVLEPYLDACRSFLPEQAAEDDAFFEGLQRVTEHLLGSTDGMASCLVCLEAIRPTDPTWQCCSGTARPENISTGMVSGCFVQLHLPCIQSWARQQLMACQAKANGGSNAAGAQRPAAWGCPKCRREFTDIPSAYACYCGAVINPPFDPWSAPHSCGEQCARISGPCGHRCSMLCHPGPCPPCPRIIDAACYCGKVTATKRCGRNEYSCGGTCGRARACGHSCAATCHKVGHGSRYSWSGVILFSLMGGNIMTRMLHAIYLPSLPCILSQGECPPCIVLAPIPCRCGAEGHSLPCYQRGVFQCAKACGKQLSCGQHTCSLVCHSGDCPVCPFAATKTCPCGKVAAPSAVCGGAVPPCGQTCGKVLDCGVHRCEDRCHVGPCTQTCRALVEKTCHCGKTTRTVQCQEMFKCERRCAGMRPCGRHPCKRRCCDGACPPCEEVCNRRLKCGNHRCPAPCHQGPCAPCPLTAKIQCACGKTAYHVPCGREGTAPPPRCQHPCMVPSVCRHAGRQPPHRCHYGPCPGRQGAPACSLSCGSQLACGHLCSSPLCHDEPPVAVAEYAPPPPPILPGTELTKRQQAQQQAAPAAVQTALAVSARLDDAGPSSFLVACPPCAAVVECRCLGGHVVMPQACSAATPFACDNPCGQELACGHHACTMPCHDLKTQACSPCTLPCQVPRECGHACPRACHPDACAACDVTVTKPCHCGKTSVDFPCHQLAGVSPAELRCGKTCLRLLPRCPHFCQEACHEGACPGAVRCEAEVTVRCTCKRLKKKLPCCEVAAMLQRTGGGDGQYDESTSLRLLPCDEECAKLAGAVSTAGKVPAAAAKINEEKPLSSGRVPASGTVPAAPKLSAKEKMEQERQRKEQERRARLRVQRIKQCLVMMVLLVIMCVGAWTVSWLLKTLDQRAHEAWGEL